MPDYYQCDLERGTERRTAFIPERYAVVGKTIRLRVNGSWEIGWNVVRSYVESRTPEAKLPHAPALVRQHRRATGDALRK